MIDEGAHAALPSSCSDDMPRSHGPHITSPRPSAGSAYSDVRSTPTVAPGTPVSVLNFVTALPLLLSMDQSHYTATLNTAQEGMLDTFTASSARCGGRLGSLSQASTTPDTATAAVRAVLYARGTPSLQAKRRRLRRLALNSFFDSTVSTRISLRRERDPEGVDGVREALAQLLLHTRTVMSDISPTKAYLVDLFAAHITCDAHSAVAALAGSPRVAVAKAVHGPPDANGAQAPGLASTSTAVMREGAIPVAEHRSIMKNGGFASTLVAASPRHGQDDTPSTPVSATIAEQLLYIILRTSIAANTPRRPVAECGDETPMRLTDGLRTPPPHGLVDVAALSSTSSSISPSAPGRLTRKKPRLDHGHSASSVVRSSEHGQSICHYASSSGGARSPAALPYQPLCWLAPSTVALVERSQALRRQQRWTCDLDPVIEATVARQGSCARSSHLCGGAGTRSAAVLSLLDSVCSSWAVLPCMADSDDAAALRGLVRGNGLPFSTASPSAVLDTARAVDPAGRSGAFQWGHAMMGEDPTIESLFANVRARCANPRRGEVVDAPEKDEPTPTSQRETNSTTAALPACRTPFVSCQPLYDGVVYAQVHLALHRCTAGLADPFCLTDRDYSAGPDLPTLRVRKEFYVRLLPMRGCTGTAAAATAISGLASLLEWGCYYGTLLRRLHRLCDVADDVTLCGTLGSYGRCAMSALRLLLCLLQRQIGELGDQPGGPHRLSFAELLVAHQRLQRAVEQIEVLAAFFGVPATETGQSSLTAPERWDPVSALQNRCSSALLLSRLYECFSARHANALGQDGSAATYYHELQQERLAEVFSSLGGEGGDKVSLQAKTCGSDADQQRQQFRAVLPALDSGTGSSAVNFLPLGDGVERGVWEQHRKELLSYSIDVIGFLLRATLRPLNTMLHRWLTAGELVDPYDEFFVVPSHGQTHSGFTLEPSPQRLPVFLSTAAATDLLHAGVSLRVLRGAATHVLHSARQDARRLEGIAEIHEAAAEDYVEELQDTQTLRRAIERFIERLVHGAPTAGAMRGMGHARTGTGDEGEITDATPLPLPPRVDVLSSHGTINWWKGHYQACTRVLLEAVVEVVNPDEGGDEDGSAGAPPDPSPWLRADEESEGRGAEGAAAKEERADGAGSFEAHVDCAELSLPCTTSAPAALDGEKGIPPDHHLYRSPRATAALHSKESMSEVPSHITVCMNSDDGEDGGVHTRMARATGGRQEADTASLATSSPRSSTAAATSVLGLRRIASSRFSIGTTVTSTASSRGTMALYGAITEELRQVSLLEQQTEADLGQSRHALRAEFDAQLWRRRREGRLADWKAQRLALRLRRVRAMESIVEELRDMYMIPGVEYDEVQESATRSIEEAAPSHESKRSEEAAQQGEGHDSSMTVSAVADRRVVVPLRQLPPPRVAPPVILYAVPENEDGADGVIGGRRVSRAFAGRSRRPSFAAHPTIVELPAASTMRHRAPSLFSMMPLSLAPAAGTHDTLPTCGVQRRSLSASALLSSQPKAPGLPSLSAHMPRRVSSATPGAGVWGSTDGDVGPAIVRQLRDVDPATLSTLDVIQKRSAVARSQSAAAAFAVPSASTSLPVPPSHSPHQRCEQVKVAMLKEHADVAAAAAADEAEGAAVRRDEFGYAHPDALFRVVDINDDEFLLMRTGPKSYARCEAEAAAMAELAERQARLAACTVDDPGYLRQLTAAVAAAVADPCCGSPKDRAALPDLCPSTQKRLHLSTKTEHHTASQGYSAEEDVETAGSAAERGGNMYRPPVLDAAWERDDPQRASPEARATMRTASMVKSFTDELWSWTAAEAHCWYFDGLAPWHRVLTGTDVDRALLGDVVLTRDEAEALQRCSGYYRALGQYTASFLTHKALQLTLLPPYGSLYRLTTQFLDVCLLQRPPVAMRLMDVWMASVDSALEMMAEAEEVALMRTIASGETRLSALAALTDTRQGLNMAEALSSLNSAFQQEWATCVTHGESTVKLEWRLSSAEGEGHERLSSAGEALERGPDFTKDSDVAETVGGCASTASRLSRQRRPLPSDSVENVPKSSPIQSFLASLSLTAASSWCSGAWLLPDHTLHCTGAIFRALLFWKSAERIVLHTWRAGMASGLSSVFFFCTTVRQVLLSSLQEALWMRLAELTATYRESLRFEAGVLYTYRSLESFTIDHAAFLRECEFYTLCGPQFQRRVCPVLQAMVDAVEKAERALRFAQVSTRVARCQYITTFRSLVSSGSSSRSGSSSDGDTEQAKDRPTPTSTPPHVFTPSRRSRRARTQQSTGSARAGGGLLQAPPSYFRPLEDAPAPHPETLSLPSETGGWPTDVASHDTDPEVDVDSARTPQRQTEKGKTKQGAQAEQSPSSVLSSATTAPSAASLLDKPLLVLGAASGGEKTNGEGDPASTAAPRKRRRRGRSQVVGARQPTAGTVAPKATKPRASLTAPHSKAQKGGRSAAVSVRQSATPTPAKKRRRRSCPQGKRLSSTERKERRLKLRAIAERKIQEEVAHQRRITRDMVSIQLARFASLTQSLRDALAEVMVKEDLKGMEDENIAAATATSDGASLKSIKDLHKTQQQHMNRYAYLSTMLQRLDALIEVMAAQV
ncbi:hypothetical protein GH5_00240 [Leishmania sp. Ghana 2012 LV757]|uniref:hypothetical protein n=1 Tax=Leishmania sp. Ghana 2012 LV757 TaxID=2803181 RepID=UPI001B3E4A02|nr:hypothetical protein GH5_00240 [Leishmania sp. Ghana 2012 LV757]